MLLVKVGDAVTRGQQTGWAGHTGAAQNCIHLHMGVMRPAATRVGHGTVATPWTFFDAFGLSTGAPPACYASVATASGSGMRQHARIFDPK